MTQTDNGGDTLLPKAAEGIGVRGTSLAVMTLSGALAGLGGASDIGDIRHVLDPKGLGQSGYGYTGIVVATLGGLSMPGVLLAAVFLGDLVVGAGTAGLELGVPSQLAEIVQGALLLVTIAFLVLRRYRVSVRRRVSPLARGIP